MNEQFRHTELTQYYRAKMGTTIGLLEFGFVFICCFNQLYPAPFFFRLL